MRRGKQGYQTLAAALGCLLAAATIGYTACGTEPAGKALPTERKVEYVKTGQIRVARVEDTREYTANILPLEEVSISSGAPGRIAHIHVDVGDRVRRGQLLVEMDSTALLTLRAQFASLSADYERMDTLRRVGSVSQQQWEQIRTQHGIMRAQLDNLASNTRLAAPIDGVVTGRYLHAGELFTMAPSPLAGGKAAILTIMQTHPIKVNVPVPEGDLGKLHPGLPVEIRLDAYPDSLCTGSVHRVAPTIDALSRTALVEVHIPNPLGRIKPGMYARVALSFGLHERVLVPDLAVQHQRGTNEKFVFVKEGNQARRIVVTLGANLGNEYVALSGLDGNEVLIVSGLQRLQDGAEIEVVE